DVQLARGDHKIFWNNGVEEIDGVVGDDGIGFQFQSGVVENMRAQQPMGLPPCSIARTDTAKGTLSSPTNDVEAFEGDLGYTFGMTPGSNCDDLILGNDPIVAGEQPVVAALPCAMDYQLSAQRTKRPSE